MNILDAIRQRRAARDFNSDPVAAAMLRQLITAASWAPSAMNEQPWHFTVITDRVLLNEISTRAKVLMLETLASVPRPNHFRDILEDAGFHIFYHAPALIVISAPIEAQWCVEDCALAAQNMMLAAHGLGLRTCWIGFAQAFLNTLEGRRALALPAQDRAVAPIIVGYPKAILPPVGRKTLAINWIGDIKPPPEDDGGAEHVANSGLYGGLIHP
jgi:nitroreductase